MVNAEKYTIFLTALALAFLIVSCGQPGITAGPEPRADDQAFAEFESELEDLRQKLKIPGLSAAIVQNQELVWSWGFSSAKIRIATPIVDRANSRRDKLSDLVRFIGSLFGLLGEKP